MNNWMDATVFHLSTSFVAGFLVGVFFFYGLKWTLKRYLSSQYIGLIVVTSLFLRMSLAVATFYYVGQEDVLKFLACLMGFLFARLVVLRLTRTSNERTV